MATFGEWMFFEHIREEVYDASIRRLHLQEALIKTLEFCDLAVDGRWDLIIENSMDDDGPAEIPDPFADGDENAPEVKMPTFNPPPPRRTKRIKKKKRSDLAPHELRAKYSGLRSPKEDEDAAHEDPDQGDDKEPETEEELDLMPSAAGSDLIRQAKEVQRLVYMSRWASMLDRRDRVEKVREIYNSLSDLIAQLPEDSPLMKSLLKLKEMQTKKESVDDDWGASYFSADTSAPSPAPKPKPKPKVSDQDVYSLIKSRGLEDKLKQLGYLKDSEIPDAYGDDIRTAIVIKKAREAAEETGNDPENDPMVKDLDAEEDVRRMADNPMLRREQYSRVMQKISDMAMARAQSMERQHSTTVRDSAGRAKKSSIVLDGQFLNDAIMRYMDRISDRHVVDGEARPWGTKSSEFETGVDDEESAKNYLRSFGSKRSMMGTIRDEERAKKKTAGMSPGSNQNVTSIDATIAGADGEATTAQYADTKALSADDALAKEENQKMMVNAFRQAMIELREKNPTWAILACLWMQLDCGPDGSFSDGNITRFFSAAKSVVGKSRQSAKDFTNKLGLAQLVQGDTRRKAELGDWELVKLVATKRAELGSSSTLTGKMPPGPPPATPPSVDGMSAYNSRKLLTGTDKLWYDKLKSIADAKGEAVGFVTERMQQIMSENDPSRRPQGWTSPCSWSVLKFLKFTYRDVLDKSVMINQTKTNPIELTLTFLDQNKKKRAIRAYSVTQGSEVEIRQVQPLGYESNSIRIEVPKNTTRCDTCGGKGEDCPECEGCGNMMDRVKTLDMEWKLKAMLDRGKRGAASPPSSPPPA